MAQQYSQEKIFKICDYIPWQRAKELGGEAIIDSKRIMDVKNSEARNHQTSVAYFAGKFNEGIGKMSKGLEVDTVQIAVVPSSKKGKVSAGLEQIVGNVNSVKVIYNPNFLNRTIDVPAAHEGGDRSMDKHYGSIAVIVKPNPDIPLILFDDVTTTGNSLNACEKILREVGVKSIYKVALAATE